jgi:hypothetical protein
MPAPTIRNCVTNQTTSQNAGGLGIDQTITAARDQVVVGEPEPAQVVDVVGRQR